MSRLVEVTAHVFENGVERSVTVLGRCERAPGGRVECSIIDVTGAHHTYSAEEYTEHADAFRTKLACQFFIDGTRGHESATDAWRGPEDAA